MENRFVIREKSSLKWLAKRIIDGPGEFGYVNSFLSASHFEHENECVAFLNCHGLDKADYELYRLKVMAEFIKWVKTESGKKKSRFQERLNEISKKNKNLFSGGLKPANVQKLESVTGKKCPRCQSHKIGKDATMERFDIYHCYDCQIDF